MKLRVCGTALLLSIAVPSVLTEAGWGSLPFFTAPTAAAQQPDAATEVARQRYEDGVKFFDQGRYEDARTAFLQTYSLKRHPAVLLNLGLSEVKSGHSEDGGNHLQQFLREHSAATPDQRTAAEKGIIEAKKKAGFIVVIVDANGAEVSLDGAIIGKAPLLDPYFVKVGKHTLLATYQGKSATTQVDAKAGTATAASLTLGTSGAAPTPAPVAPAPVIPTPAPTQPAAPPMAPTIPTGPAAGAPPPPPQQQPMMSGSFTGPGLPPDQGTSEREPFFDWYKRKPIAWVGTGVAGAGLIVGIAFSAAASAASSSADEHVNDIKEEARRRGDSGPPCGDPDTGAGDNPHYAQACDVLRDDISDHDTDVAAATVGWVFFGVGVVGTAAYAMIDWFPKKKPSTGALDPRIVAIAPVVTSTQQGVGLVGSF